MRRCLQYHAVGWSQNRACASETVSAPLSLTASASTRLSAESLEKVSRLRSFFACLRAPPACLRCLCMFMLLSNWAKLLELDVVDIRCVHATLRHRKLRDVEVFAHVHHTRVCCLQYTAYNMRVLQRTRTSLLSTESVCVGWVKAHSPKPHLSISCLCKFG